MIGEGVINAIRAAVGIDGVSTRETDLRVYGADLWPRLNILKLYGGRIEDRPDAIVWPRSVEAVGQVLAICSKTGIPVIPFGGGSGVCGGTLPVQGGVMLDLKRMNRIREIDELSMSVDVEAGMIGQHLETALNERGYTLGHFPSSIMCSTTGGWVATRSAGQFSSRYGKIEDMVLSIEAVLPDGSVAELETTRNHFGEPDFAQLIMGSEGTLGVVTRVRLRIYPMPPFRRFGGFRFMDVTSGLEAMRNIMQQGLRPAVMRLYDPLDTLINNFSMSSESDHHEKTANNAGPALLGRTLGVDPSGLSFSGLSSALTGPLLRKFLAHPGLIQRALDLAPLSCLLVVGFEGEGIRTRQNMDRATDLAVRATGRALGPGPGEFWMRHRYSVSFKLSKVFAQGAFAETLEVAGLWRDVPAIYRKVRRAVLDRVSVMAHFSHAYREGCAIYFTFSGYNGNGPRLVGLYDEVVRKALSAAMDAGATVSHHHGIGLMKRAFTPDEYHGGERLFWAVKQALDPSGIMNPQKVYPPTVRFEPKEERDAGAGNGNDEFDSIVSWDHKTGDKQAIAPEVPEEISDILRLADKAGRGIICQNATPPVKTDRRVRAVDLSRMDEILDMDPVSGTVTFQAGMTVLQLENFLREKGFTIGLVPKSRLLMSFGEFLARSSPSKGSPRYGTVQDNCLGLSAVLPDGTPFAVRPCPRRSAGPDLMHCFLGAGGRYGIITGVCLRVFPVPTVREAVAFATDDPVMTCSAIRTILVRHARPEKVLMVIRAPSKLGRRRRIRTVFQFGGMRASVSRNLAVVRSVMESLGMEGESVRAEDRQTPVRKRAPSIERHLPMDRVMALCAALGEMEDDSCPEAHVTDMAPQGATFRLLLREDRHVYPPEVLSELSAPELPDTLAGAADRVKEILDPEGTLNPE
ncbi:MAG: FAD-binding oxidoreductase [Deltaproteobacteria bacterium]|nr:FAD-binding oxidoreductase [Deltaproteobacteria bacterium]